MAKASGTTGTVVINAVTYRVAKYDVTGTNDWQDVTDTGSNGYQETIPGVRSSSGSFDIFVDIAAPPAIDDSDFVTNLVLGNTIGGTSLTAYSCASAGVDSLAISNDVKGTLTYTVNFHSTGQFQFGALGTPT